MPSPKPELYLASQSPRRKELLEQIGVNFEVLQVSVPEVRAADEDPADYVVRLSRDKSTAGARLVSGLPVLGADTIVVANEQVLEKPKDLDDGVRMLLALSGKNHDVLTAVTICKCPGGGESASSSYQIDNEGNGFALESAIVKTTVSFREINQAEAERYWLTGEPQDKAGGYGIQGFGAVFVQAINGCYSNVVGLPLARTSQLLSRFGVSSWQAKQL